MEKKGAPGALRAKWGPLPSRTRTDPSTEPASPHFFDKNPIPSEPSVEALRSLNKLTENSKKIISNLESNNTILSERIEMLTAEANENQDRINSLYSRISSLSLKQDKDEANKYTTIKYMETESFISQISPNTTEEFLKNKPMILEALLHPGYADMLADLIKNLPQSSKSRFISYTGHQLQRFSLIWSSFLVLSMNLNKPDFKSIIMEAVRKILESDTTFYFLKDISTGVYACDLPNDITIYVKDPKSLIPQTTTTQIFNHPSESPNFNRQVDSVFNPKDRSCIVVPARDAASVLAIRSDDSSLPFKNEDISVGDIFSLLNSSLIIIDQKAPGIITPNDYKKKVDDFERNCLKIDRMENLVPFIDNNFPKLIGADIIKLFFIDHNELIFNVLTEEKTALDKKLPFAGITHHIAKTRRIFIEQKLEESLCHKKVDSWCIGKSFYGAPIMSSTNECIAVLCAAAPRGTLFTEEQLEAAMVIAPTMSLVVQRVTETKSKEHLEAGIKDFSLVPEKMAAMSFNHDDIFNTLYKAMNVDSMTVYRKGDGENPKKLYEFGRKAFSEKFVKDQFERGSIVNTTSPNELPNFEPIQGFSYRSVFICFESRGSTRYGIFCANPLNLSNRLHDNSESIARAFCNFSFNITDEEQFKKDVKIQKQRLLTVQGVTEVAKKHMETSNLAEFCRGIGSFAGFEQACLYIYDAQENSYFAHSTKNDFRNIRKTPDIDKLLKENRDVFELKYEMYKKTQLEADVYGKKAVIINFCDDIFMLFIGKEIGDSIYTFNAFLPIIKSHANYCRLFNKNLKSQIKKNIFVNLPKIQDPLDYKIKIGNLNKDEMLGLSIYLLNLQGNVNVDICRRLVKSAMKMSKGLWSSCVECMQFSAAILELSESLFTKKQKSAILIASLFWLLNDPNDNSAASVCFGDHPDYLVRLERAMSASLDSGLPEIDEDFWPMLSKCFCFNAEEEYKKIEVFDSSNHEQLNLIGAMITKISEFRRYFALESKDDVTAAVSRTVGEEIVLPLFDKLLARIPKLSSMKESLMNTINCLSQ